MNIKKIESFDGLFLTQDCNIYDAKKNTIIYPSQKHCFKIKDITGKWKTVCQKTLYKKVYNKIYCIDQIPDLQGQYWLPINQYYYCSNLGRIKSLKGYESKILKQFLNKKENGYYKVKLTINGKIKSISVHRIVAELFVPKPIIKDSNTKIQIHHKNGKRQDNRAINLRWVTKEEHIKLHNSK